jgi:translocation protein SEC63
MKLSPLVVQALWDKQSPLMQLPHIEEDMLKHFHSRKRNIKTLQQVAKMKVSNIFLILFATVEAA